MSFPVRLEPWGGDASCVARDLDADGVLEVSRATQPCENVIYEPLGTSWRADGVCAGC